jgi:hypothetical protein
MVEIPMYLKDFTKINKISKDAVLLKVLCNCGCSTFYMLESLLDIEEENIIKEYDAVH